MLAHAFNLTLEKQADFCKCKVNLVYRVKEVQASQNYTVKPCFNK